MPPRRCPSRRLLMLALSLTGAALAACGDDALPTAVPSATPCFTPQTGQDNFADKVTLSTQKDGLRTGDIRAGCGPAAKTGDNVTVEYTGWLTTGQKFDSSRGRQPFSFTIGQGVIKGWSEGVPGMKVGGKRRLAVPPALGYGTTAQAAIPANSTLVFDIELLSVG